ncbi:MAG: DUF4363 family protein [Clostridia bacterium]|nr:DUF4363 family protein [Clostridia bacterium]
MKEKIIAIVLFFLVVISVGLNTFFLAKQIKSVTDNVKSIDITSSGAKDDAEKLFDEYMKKERFISLTVSHNDLTTIEDCFVEMIGYLSIGDTDNAEVAKSRLIHSFEHLRRLSGFNIDAII